MPPKISFTREDILNAAFEIVRQEGLTLSSRKIAAKLNSSTRPIYSHFSSIEELEQCVLDMAYEIMLSYITFDSDSNSIIQMGIGYIKFARDEKQLYKALFIDRGLVPDKKVDIYGSHKEILKIIDLMKNTIELKSRNLSQNEIIDEFFDRWVYVHGFASLIVCDFLINIDDEFIENRIKSFNLKRRD